MLPARVRGVSVNVGIRTILLSKMGKKAGWRRGRQRGMVMKGRKNELSFSKLAFQSCVFFGFFFFFVLLRFNLSEKHRVSKNYQKILVLIM